MAKTICANCGSKIESREVVGYAGQKLGIVWTHVSSQNETCRTTVAKPADPHIGS